MKKKRLLTKSFVLSLLTLFLVLQSAAVFALPPPPPPPEPQLEMSQSVYAEYETIVVNYSNVSSGDRNWIGIYEAGADNTDYGEWYYTLGATSGTMYFNFHPPGSYEARLFYDDSYNLETEVSFTVVAGGDPEVDCTLNPYDGVNWSTYNQYKANFHTHTTESDGDHSPAQTIDQYHSAGYKILALTDHNAITWPWTDYGRNPSSLNMLAVKGDEYSNSHHMNALFNFSTSSSNLQNGIPHVQSSGGLSFIAHPGRYHVPSEWEWYIHWYSDYDTCIGLEVINRDDYYQDDRYLWDNINEYIFPYEDKMVWGFANDDKHTSDDLYHAFQFMLMPALTETELRQCMQDGAFYFCMEPGGSGEAKVPRINSIIVDEAAKTITISATGYQQIYWVGPGTTTVGTGTTFDYEDYTHQPFVRAVLDGKKGDSYTQPFGFVTNFN